MALQSESRTLPALDEASRPPVSSSPYLALLRALFSGVGSRIPSVAVAAVLCRRGLQTTAVFGPPTLPQDDVAALGVAVQEAFIAFAGDSHRACIQEPLVFEARESLAPPSVPAMSVDAPLLLKGQVVGLLRAVISGQATELVRKGVYDLAAIASAALEALEAAREEEQGLLTHLADGLADGVILVGGDGRLLLANEPARRLLGDLSGLPEGAEVALGRTPVAELVRQAQAAGAAREVEYSLEEGQRRYLSARAQPLPQGVGAVVLLRDVTEERLLQERLLQSEKMASVGQLVSGVAHELNNPLTGVMGFAQLLLMRDLDERSRREVETILGEAERAAKIVQNLLSFARRRKAEKELVDLNVLLQRVLELRSYDLRLKNISLEMDLDPQLTKTLADADQLQQVFFNIIINAEQAMLQAQGRGRLTVRSAGAGDRIRVVFADDGPGIARENLRRIFDPFFTTKDSGTGLGLTIAYGIVEDHGGRITVDSAMGRGATFTLEMPVVPGPAQGPEEEEVKGRATAVAGQRILVVDDEESIQALLRDVLSQAGHDVDSAGNGLEALERLEAGHYDLVITDIKMPEMSGQEFYRRVREKDRDLARSMVFITGDTINTVTRQFLQRVQNPCLAKPFKLREVREVVERQLSGEADASSTPVPA